MPRKWWYILGGCVALLGITLGFVLTAGPSYKHGWCGAVLSTVIVPNGASGSMSSKIDQLAVEEHGGAPVGPILAEEKQALEVDQALIQDNENLQNGDASQSLQFAQDGVADSAEGQVVLEAIKGQVALLGADCGAHVNTAQALAPNFPSGDGS